VKYADFFIEVPRLNGSRKPAQVLKSDRYLEFMEIFAQDKTVPAYDRVWMLLMMGSGARITEIHKIKKQDIDLKRGKFHLIVLKKNHSKLNRYAQNICPLCASHFKKGKRKRKPPHIRHVPRRATIPKAILNNPELLQCLETLLTHRRPHEFVFRDSDRHAALYRVKKIFGGDMENHSFRHGYIAYLMHVRKTGNQIADIVKIDLKTVQAYAHVTNIDSELASTGI